ncbi:hypothetical protein D3C76_858160 [compost metagenome]
MLREEVQYQMWNGALVGRVQVEVVGADHEVFRVGRLQDQKARRFQGAQSVGHQCLQAGKGHVFGDMEP